MCNEFYNLKRLKDEETKKKRGIILFEDVFGSIKFFSRIFKYLNHLFFSFFFFDSWRWDTYSIQSQN